MTTNDLLSIPILKLLSNCAEQTGPTHVNIVWLFPVPLFKGLLQSWLLIFQTRCSWRNPPKGSRGPSASLELSLATAVI